MEQESGATRSVWMEKADIPLHSKLEQNAAADVCVVGGGIAGLSTAYELCRAGLSVIVLEDGEIGSGETGRTTAHLVNALDQRYGEIEEMHGETVAQLAAGSHTMAIDEIEAIVSRERIECEFERLDGFLIGPWEDDHILGRELKAGLRAGLHDLEVLPRAPLAPFDTGPCLRFPRQAQFHPLKFLAGLAAAIQRLGGAIHTHTNAGKIEGGEAARVETSTGQVVTAKHIVMATNTPVNDRITMHTMQAAYRTYVIGAHIPKGSLTRALYWDTKDPYHYVRVQAESEVHDVLIVGGEDHKTGQAADTEERFGRLATWAMARFPMIKYVPYRWSGQVLETVDGLAFIGRNPWDAPKIYIATGTSGNGITYGAIAGMLLTDLILGKQNPWSAVYDPSRITLKSAGKYAAGAANVALQYTSLIIAGCSSGSPQELQAGSGTVVGRGIRKVAVYRDPQEELHEFSAVCPHLGCVVSWNPAEKTWDCPCHGSRFSAMGQVVSGPASSGLDPAT